MEGLRVKERRKELKLSAQDVADELGTTRVTVSRWESGISEPNDKTKKALANVLKTSVAYLMGETDNPVLGANEVPEQLQLQKAEKSQDISYWGNFLENIQKVARSGNSGEISSLEQLIQKLNEIQLSLPPKDINKGEKIKDPLLGLTYWGGVVDNARRVASEGTEQEKNTVSMMLNMAFNAFQKEERTLNSMEKTAQNVGVQQNNFNGDNNYNGDIPKVATA